MSSICRRLVGRTAIVTASTEGIGFAIAKRLGLEGANVVVSSRKEANVNAAVELLKNDGSNVEGTVCHIGKEDDRQNLVNFTLDRFGGLDILVSNAAVNHVYGAMADTTPSDWDKIFDINVKSAFFVAKACLPHLKKSEHPSIVFVSSIAGFDAMPGISTYSVSKTALLGMTKAMAKELGPDGIRVNGLAPGLIQTKFSSALTTDERMLKSFLRQVPLRRVGLPSDMAGTVAFLASDDSNYLTGETIPVTGGMHTRL